jgi:glycosyltransferase involved in cell wall biosynthesis
VVTPAVGRLVAPADPAQLAEAVCDLLSDPQARAEMSDRGRKRVVAEYDWERIAGRHIALYRSMLA